MHTRKKIFLFIVFLISLSRIATAQINIIGSQTAAALAQKLAGSGVTISNPTLNCPAQANGIFNVVSSNLGLDSGIILTTGRAATPANPGTSGYGANGPQSSTTNANASVNNGTGGDAQLTALAGQTTYDACALEFDVIPSGDTLKFNYVFGSEEYINSVCAQYNDVFAFFISGPGIVGTPNIALVPGTNVPVAVNSINNGVPGTNSNGTLSQCTVMGPGSPFTSYYVNNVGGTTVTYYGFTQVLTAVKAVTRCQTYHLKLAIADASNHIYDSGVFLKAGSLSAGNLSVLAQGVGITPSGQQYIVKGCAPGHIVIKNSQANPTPTVVNFNVTGTAAAGVDYASFGNSATIPANDTQVTVNVTGLSTAQNGPKTLVLALQNGCANDTVSMVLYDAPIATLANHDTTICTGSSVQLSMNITPQLNITWSPGGSGLSNNTIPNPIATPTTTTTYTYNAVWPNAGCAPLTGNITITLRNPSPVSITTADTTICKSDSVHIRVSGSDTLQYSWSAATGLNNTNIKEPVATPATTTTYTVTVPQGICPASTDNITITVDNPPAIQILTKDTTICPGTSLPIFTTGTNVTAYSWTPGNTLNNAAAQNPTATPTASTTTYIVAATSTAVCPVAYDTLVVGVTPPFQIHPFSNQPVCENDTMQLNVTISPAANNYHYTWNGPAGFNSTIANPMLDAATVINKGMYYITVYSHSINCNASDSVYVDVKTTPAPFVVSPVEVCIHKAAAPLTARGENLKWYTSYVGDAAISNAPVPNTKEINKYQYFVSQTIDGCTGPKSVIDVSVVECCSGGIGIPSVFSPNGDGKNDVFRVVLGYGYKLNQFMVFNRWGQMVFKSTDANNGWDGTFNGEMLDMGTYYYYAAISCTSSAETTLLEEKGDITLVR